VPYPTRTRTVAGTGGSNRIIEAQYKHVCGSEVHHTAFDKTW
jgi:hypothetical protein